MSSNDSHYSATLSCMLGCFSSFHKHCRQLFVRVFPEIKTSWERHLFYSRSELSGGAAQPQRHFHSCIVLRRSAPAPGLARQSRSPSGGRRFALLGGIQFFCSSPSLLYKKRHFLTRVPDLKAEDLRRSSRIPFIACSVDLKPGDCELVVNGGRALQPCRYRWCTHMSCIIIYPYSTYPCRGYFHTQ